MRRAATLAAFAAVAASTLTARAVRAQSLTTVRIAMTAADDATPLLYADKAGLFRRTGLSLEITAMRFGTVVAQAVIGGAADIGRSSTLPIVTGHAKGIPFTLIAPGGMYLAKAPGAGIVVPTDSPIRSAADLNGKTISVPGLKALSDIATEAWIDQHGGDSTSVRYVELPEATVLAALGDGRVVAAALENPFFADVLASGKARLLGDDVSALGAHLLQTAWFSTTGYASKNPDVIRHFAQVMRDAAVYTNGHHAETVDLLAAFAKLEPATIARMTRAEQAPFLDARDIQPLVDAAFRYKVIEKRFDASELISSLALRPR
jgi:NitT/TauT family transport system substrate-binding protein